MSQENMPGHRTHAQEQSPSRSAPNFGHGGRATTVTAAVQPRCHTRARRRRPRHATPPRATHRHGTVTNLGGTTTRRHPQRTPAAAQPPPPPPPRGRLDSVRALPCPGKFIVQPSKFCTVTRFICTRGFQKSNRQILLGCSFCTRGGSLGHRPNDPPPWYKTNNQAKFAPKITMQNLLGWTMKFQYRPKWSVVQAMGPRSPFGRM